MKLFENQAGRPRLLEDNEIKSYLAIIGVLLLVLIATGIFANKWAGLFLVVLILAIVVTSHRFITTYLKRLNDYILDLSYRIKRGEQEAIIQMPIGILMYNNFGEIQWINPYLQSQLSVSVLGKEMKEIHPTIGEQLQKQMHSEGEESIESFIIEWNGKQYDVSIHNDVQTIYLMEVSKYLKIEEDYQMSRPVFGWLNLDNYDEIVKGLDDRDISEFDNIVTTYLSNWAHEHQVYYKRLADDRYLLLLQYGELKKLQEEKFSVIENIRKHTTKRNAPLTISIGIAFGNTNFIELDEIAQRNVDLALSRGGDQAVIREVGGKPTFYGGNTNPMERRTRVRARMISESLQQEMKQSETTYVMGHRYPDMDAIGSALGVARIAKMIGQECKVVIDYDHIGLDIRKLMKEIEKYPETLAYFISAKEAEKAITAKDLIVLVDHHMISLSIAPQLFKKNNRFVVIDHHRLGQESEVEPIFAYIEPYASSASELVTEFFEHVPVVGVSGINRIEATAMLGGIIVDTNSFSLRTGSRTYNAASYLQSMGANPALIQRLLKESPEDYFKRNEIIEKMEEVTQGVVIACGKLDQIYTQVMAAQTADTILTMEGIEAAFVIVPLKGDKIGISARSLGELNVQRVMEKMGGGGHLTNAGAQLEDTSITEVKTTLIQILTEK
ncbi:DHH family phosphoesterase [Allofustis seminis]|uniref:DHH family phosphoesterase n=1 Tax=Allofustis seminis TaxID=166939 RepID=UPI00035E2269|nr:DHH family phosphoesterase [Allofustis seminis]